MNNGILSSIFFTTVFCSSIYAPAGYCGQAQEVTQIKTIIKGDRKEVAIRLGGDWTAEKGWWGEASIDSLKMITEPEHRAKTVLELKCGFITQWAPVALAPPKKIEIADKPVNVMLWVYGDPAADGVVNVIIHDKTGEEFWAQVFLNFQFEGWVQGSCPLSLIVGKDELGRCHSWGGGNNDRNIDLPATLDYVVCTGRSGNSKARLLFDNLTVTTEEYIDPARVKEMEAAKKLKWVTDTRKVMGKKDETAPVDYVVCVEPSVKKFFPKVEDYKGKVRHDIEVSLAGNEYEAFQLVVVPLEKELKKIAVKLEDLKDGRTGEVFKKENLSFRRVGYVETHGPVKDVVERIGWWPDPLMPGAPFDAKSGNIESVWVTVHVPAGTMPGTYEGTVEISPEDSTPTAVKVAVRVWDFTLPVQQHLRNTFAFFEFQVNAFYNWEGGSTIVPQERRRKWLDFLLEHRVSVVNPFGKIGEGDLYKHRDDLEYCIEKGQDVVLYGYIDSEKDLEGKINQIKEAKKYVDEKGWQDKAYLFGFDEVLPTQKVSSYTYEEAVRAISMVKKELPDVKFLATFVPAFPDFDKSEWVRLVDVPVPLAEFYFQEREKIEKVRAEMKKECWMYWIYGAGDMGMPATYVEAPAIDFRLMPWFAWKYNMRGLLHWAMNYWWPNTTGKYMEDAYAGERLPDRWPNIPWDTWSCRNHNGDAHWFYPGPDGLPISSIRFENLRDGLEDYEYLYLLKEKLEELKKSKKAAECKNVIAETEELLKVESVARSLVDCTRDPDEFYKARARAAEQIIKIQGIILPVFK